MARTFGTCERDARSRMVRQAAEMARDRYVESVESGNDPAMVQDSTFPHRVDREFHF